MAYTPFQFQPQTYLQSNPFLEAISRSTMLQGQELANNNQKMANDYQPQLLQQQLLKEQLANQLSGVQVKYADPMAQAGLAYSRAQTPNLNAQTGLYGAQGRFYDAQSANLPYKTQAELLMAQAKMGAALASTSRNFQAYQKTNEWAQIVKDDPALAMSMVRDVQRNAAMVGGYQGPYGSAPPQQGQQGDPNGQPPQMPQQTTPDNFQATIQGMGQQQAPAAPQPQQPQGQPGMQQDAQGAPQPQQGQLPPIVQQLLQTAEDRRLKSVIGEKNMQQLKYGNIAEGIIKDSMPIINNAIQYQGMGGMFEKNTSRLMQSTLGTSSQQYRDFQTFKTVTAPNIANEVRRALGGQATDHEQKLLNSVVDPTRWDYDTKQQVQNLNELLGILRRNTQELSRTPSQAVANAQENRTNPIQVTGEKNITMPQFDNKNEFNAWFEKQPPVSQAMIRSSLK